jgi:outer membrane protein assembly factor BamB
VSAVRRLAFAAALLVLAACSKDKDVNPPAELVGFNATLKVQRAWSASVGGNDEKLRLGLGLGVDGQSVFAAGHGGEVAAFDVATGRSLWRAKTKAPLAGGTGAGAGLVVVGSQDGDVIALDEKTGAARWRKRVKGEVLTAPAVSAREVVVRTVDGRLRGLSAENGREIWVTDQTIPRLTLRGTAPPVISGDTVVAGFDNGKVVAVGLADGQTLWEQLVAPSRGRTELERLVDIDSAVKVSGADVFVVGFQGRVAMLSMENGQAWWSRDASSYRGLDIDADNVYYSTADGNVVAVRRKTGTPLWTQDALAHRGLSAPAVHAGAEAVGDFQGYVHWLDPATGALVARAKAGGKRISMPPVVAGDLLLVIDDDGHLDAFRAAPTGARAAPPRADASAAPAAQGEGAGGR